MRNISSDFIENSLKTYPDNGTQLAISFDPAIDNKMRFEIYTAKTLAENFTQVVS
jgi:hypothetical protein